MQGIQETQVRSLDREDPLEKEIANPLQYSCLENPMDRGAWQATVPKGLKEWYTTEVTERKYMHFIVIFIFILSTDTQVFLINECKMPVPFIL